MTAIEEIPGPRWEIALLSLRERGPLVLLPGDAPVGLQRYDDGRVHVSIFTQAAPSELAVGQAQREVDAGLAVVRAAEAADPRLTQIFDMHGVVYEYVWDYGNGAVQIGEVTGDGTVRLL